jgi:NAD(P)-dependent dehydrogenase (short-subunit alcohol dehydrogenase family)
MGQPVCAALVRAGHEVSATDKDPERKADVLACGAAWEDSPALVAATADVLITMLPGPDEVRAAMTGVGGALGALKAGATWIDLTNTVKLLVNLLWFGQAVATAEASWPAPSGTSARSARIAPALGRCPRL